MNENRISRWTGWAFILGGLAFAVGFFIGEAAIFLGTFLLAPIFLGAGMLGLRARYGDEMGNLGKYVLLAGVVGSAIALVGALGQILVDDRFFIGTAVGLTTIFVSIVLFGAVALQRKLLPRWNGLPVLAGVWMPTLAVFRTISEVFKVDLGPIPDSSSMGVIIITGVALLLLGVVLHADAARKTATA